MTVRPQVRLQVGDRPPVAGDGEGGRSGGPLRGEVAVEGDLGAVDSVCSRLFNLSNT
ncbi:hypothetical protein HBB16_06705 [Pseudonocardia sp. MCCB 268]|nr:hypothetical protein [Pseudonocardia cytotoxica]